ncbi:MAG TPA: DUF1488 family protein [Pseudolabrys sp.]|nr:DUF1488 family protein [Pseudolabrys sp.]
MTLRRGDIQGYDFDRMIVEFTMLEGDTVVQCAISTAAMDDLEGRRDARSTQRLEQFARLRDTIEARAARKFAEEPAAAGARLVLRSVDFV